MESSTLVRRGMLYVPASSEKMLEKSRGLKGLDCVVYDLEDSVSVGKKKEARNALRAFLESSAPENVKEIAVRINSVDSGYALHDMLQMLPIPTLDAIVIPKTESASDMHFITEVVKNLLPARHSPNPERGARSPIRLIPMIESAKGLQNLNEICSASPLISALAFGAEDFCLGTGIRRSASLEEVLYTRSTIVAAARAHGLESIMDLVCVEFKGESGEKKLAEECAHGKNLGFTGKQLIHPAQIETAQKVYGPDEKEVEWAVRVVVADEKAAKLGKGAWSLDGHMVDVPVVGQAKRIVAKAEACGFDIKELTKKHKDQQPE